MSLFGKEMSKRPSAQEDLSRDLGLGGVMSQQKRLRLLNRDGSFNVGRKRTLWSRFTSYHALLTMSWSRFIVVIICGYLLANLIFAAVYVLCGPGTLLSSAESSLHSRFLQAFFFSVHTFATIGYGNTIPVGVLANIVVTIESLTSILGFAIATGLVFSRFSRPVAKIMFSNLAVIAPYNEITAFQFRIANTGANQIIELGARVLFSRFEEKDGVPLRRYYPLNLERDRVAFFPLAWTVVHPIDINSPLYGATQKDLIKTEAELLILLTGTDETFSQTVHARSSYRADEIVWNAKFVNVYSGSDSGLAVDFDRLHQVEKIATAAPSFTAPTPF